MVTQPIMSQTWTLLKRFVDWNKGHFRRTYLHSTVLEPSRAQGGARGHQFSYEHRGGTVGECHRSAFNSLLALEKGQQKVAQKLSICYYHNKRSNLCIGMLACFIRKV